MTRSRVKPGVGRSECSGNGPESSVVTGEPRRKDDYPTPETVPCRSPGRRERSQPCQYSCETVLSGDPKRHQILYSQIGSFRMTTGSFPTNHGFVSVRGRDHLIDSADTLNTRIVSNC